MMSQQMSMSENLTGLKDPKTPGRLEPGDPEGHEKQLQRSQSGAGPPACQLDSMLQGSPWRRLSRGAAEPPLGIRRLKLGTWGGQSGKEARLEVRELPWMAIAIHAGGL